MWTLVFIYFFEVTPYVELVSTHTSMTECFQAREALSGVSRQRWRPILNQKQQAILH